MSASSCTIGDAVQVDLPVAEGAHQVMHIVSILDRGVGIQVDPLPYQAVVAGAYLQKRRICHRGKFRAVQRGLRVADAALVQQDEITITGPDAGEDVLREDRAPAATDAQAHR